MENTAAVNWMNNHKLAHIGTPTYIHTHVRTYVLTKAPLPTVYFHRDSLSNYCPSELDEIKRS